MRRFPRPPLGPLLVSLALLASLALGGCFDDDDGGEATGTPTAAGTKTASVGPQSTAVDAPTVAATRPPRPEHPHPNTVTPLWIAGLSTYTYCGVDGRRSYTAAYPVVSGLQPLTDVLDANVRSQIGLIDETIKPIEEHLSTDCTAHGISESVSVQVDVLVATGDVVGVRLTRLWLGASGHISQSTIWFDLRIRQVLRAVDLLDGDEALADLSALARAALEERREAWDSWRGTGSSLHTPEIEDRTQPTPENFNTLGFDEQGRLVVSFDEGQVGYGAEGPISIALDRAVVEPLLSDFGRRVLAETVDPSGSLHTRGAP